MEEKIIRFEAPEKPEIEFKEIVADTTDFEEPEKAKALIKNLGLSVGDTIRENEDEFIINPKMVLEGNAPEHYKRTIENLKKILTKEEITQIDNYIKRKNEDDKVKDKIYYAIDKRIDGFYWRGNIKKSLSEEIKEVLEFFKADNHIGLMNTIYHLLSKDKKDYIKCYKLAWKNKPIPNIQEWRETNEGEYRVLTDSEADREARSYLEDDDDMWKMVVESGNTTEGFEDWIDSVLSCDGRASILSGYDGCEEEETINEIDYYIYRTN